VSASPSKDIKVEEFRRRMIEWYEKHGDKHLPWRKTEDGWAVLVASLLLRKTTVAQVVNVYSEFLRKFPSPQSLLSASEDDVKSIIKPLGIEHQRAKHFKELAKILLERFGGKVPCDRKELKKLPGIGDYIASEILLRIRGQPEPLLDRNMIRVVGRVFGVRSAKKRPHTDPELWSFARELVPKNPEEAEKFNFGVLDFARKVCTVRNPHCVTCPAKDLCQAFRNHAYAQSVY
jgi:A/G-specific adenine glycosylase